MPSRGHVYLLRANAFSPPKLKYLVLAYVGQGDRARFFVINSKRTPLQKATPDLRTHLISLPKGLHEFLKHDSWLDCTELIGGWTGAEIREKLKADPNCHICKLSAEILARVGEVVSQSRVLPEREKALILAQWPG